MFFSKNDMEQVNRYTVVGLMSGTSVDGLDVCISEYLYNGKQWDFKILYTETLSYYKSLKDNLVNICHSSSEKNVIIEQEFSSFVATSINKILDESKFKPDFIASHGHTAFHDPLNNYTYQIGNSELIAKRTGLPVISDFRRGDVALGGQGAPLVPIGDWLLFGSNASCLNLGGFSNISFNTGSGERIAYDISPLNIVLNRYARELGFEYDESGEIAKSGKVIPDLLSRLNSLEFYNQKPPKSLSIEWVNKFFKPILDDYQKYETRDMICTLTTHMADIIAKNLDKHVNCLVTGGGAYNTYMIDLIKSKTNCDLIIPNNQIIDFKEALVFGFLGVLRWRKEINVLSSVTGASRDSSCGIISIP